MKGLLSAFVVITLVVVVAGATISFNQPTIVSATQFLESRGYSVIPATFADDITAIKNKTSNLPLFPASEITSQDIYSNLNSARGNLTLIKAKTDLIPAAGIADNSTLTLVKTKTDLITTAPATEATLLSVAANVTANAGVIATNADEIGRAHV